MRISVRRDGVPPESRKDGRNLEICAEVLRCEKSAVPATSAGCALVAEMDRGELRRRTSERNE